jgi:hypothetical protein
MPQCQECNAGLPAGAKFCGRCGAPVASQPDTALTMPVTPAPSAQPPAVPPPAAPPAQNWPAGPAPGAADAPTQRFVTPSQGPGGPAQRLGGPAQGPDAPTQGLGAPTQGLGGPAQGLGGPAHRLGGPAQGPGGPAQALGGQGQGMGGPAPGMGAQAQGLGELGFGAPAPVAPGPPPWQARQGGPAPVAPGPPQWQGGQGATARAYPQDVPQQGGTSGQAATGGVLAILGAIGIIGACALPIYTSPSGFGGTSASFSLFKEFGNGTAWWFLVEPVGVAVLALVAGVVIMASRSRIAPLVAAGILLGFGIQTAFLFLGYWRAGFGGGAQAGPAGIVGLLSGVVLAVAGLVAGAAARRT